MKRPKLRTSFYADFCPILNVRRCIFFVMIQIFTFYSYHIVIVIIITLCKVKMLSSSKQHPPCRTSRGARYS